MIIRTYTLKYKSYGGPLSQKKVDMEPWTLHSMSRLKFKILFDLHFSHSLSYLSWRSLWFENILSNTRHREDTEVQKRKMWSSELHIACQVWNLKCFLSSFSPFLIIFIFKVMIIWEYSFKYKTTGGPWSQKKEDMEPYTSYIMSRLKLKMPFDLSFFHSLKSKKVDMKNLNFT